MAPVRPDDKERPMVKKQQKTAPRKKGREADRATDNPFAQRVRESAQQIWSAGLAAFAKAQGEGGKVLDELAGETEKLRRQARAAEVGLQSAAHRMSDLAGEVGARTGQHWDKLESIFEDRVARAMSRLGMPSSDDFARLSGRIDLLAAAVAALQAQIAAAPAVPVKSAAPTRAKAKAAVPKKSTKAATPAVKAVKKVKTATVKAAKPAARSRKSVA